MSQENVEVVRCAYQAFNDHDLDALLANYTDDVEWRLIGGFADLMGTEFIGRDALRGFFSEWIGNLGGQAKIESILEANDQVVLIMSMAGEGGASGAPATVRAGQVFSFRDGLISAVDTYYEPSDALEAVGLSE